MLVILALLRMGDASGQAHTQFQPKAGFSIYQYQDEVDLQDGMSHPGFHIGFDVPIRESNWIITPGFYYHRIGIRPGRLSLRMLFSNRRNLHYAQMPFSFGRLFKAGELVELVPYLGADMLFFLSVDENDLNIANPDLRSFQAGARLGGQVRLAEHFTFDATCQFAFMPSFNNREKSSLSGYSFAFGYLF